MMNLKKRRIKKRKDDDVPAEDLRLAKRRCMDGTNHVERVVGEPIPIEFSQALYDTEVCVAVPLPFFLTRNLRTLVDEASTLHEKHSAISQSGIARASPTLFLGWNIVREG